MTATAVASPTITLHNHGRDWSVTTSPSIHEMNNDIVTTKALTDGLEDLFDDLSRLAEGSTFDAAFHKNKLSKHGVVFNVRSQPAAPSSVSSNCTTQCQTTDHLTIYPSIKKSESGTTFLFKACSNPSLYVLPDPSVKSFGDYGTAAPDVLRIWQILSRTASKRSSAITAGSEALSDEAELQGMSEVLTLAWRLLQNSPDCRNRTVKLNIRVPGTANDKIGTVSEDELEKGKDAWMKAYLEAKSDEDMDGLDLSGK